MKFDSMKTFNENAIYGFRLGIGLYAVQELHSKFRLIEIVCDGFCCC